jgi:hypothetical protein
MMEHKFIDPVQVNGWLVARVYESWLRQPPMVDFLQTWRTSGCCGYPLEKWHHGFVDDSLQYFHLATVFPDYETADSMCVIFGSHWKDAKFMVTPTNRKPTAL